MHQSLVQASRVLMGDSLGFHIIFLMFGLAIPVLVIWFEYLGFRKKDEKLINLAKLWSKIMTVLIVAGVMSGTIVALQMSLVWPGILKFGGKVIGLPFLFESYAFILEAVFIALYMLTWNNKKVSRITHMLFGAFIVIGGTLSAYSITAVNAFMNLPSGFSIISGKVSNVEVWKALFSRTTIIEFIHSMLGYYLAVVMVFAGVYAFKRLRSKGDNKINRFVILHMLGFAALIMILSVITGDLSGKYLAEYEPVKLAQLEAINKTSDHEPLIIGGILNDQGQITGPHFRIPNGLSILVGNSPSTVVKGLDLYPKDSRPPTYVHIIYDVKLALVGALITAIFGLLILFKFYKKSIDNKILLSILSIVGFLGIVIVELGWMITEIGRQPWAVRGYVTTSQAINSENTIRSFGYIFPFLFLVLAVVTFFALKRVTTSHEENK